MRARTLVLLLVVAGCGRDATPPLDPPSPEQVESPLTHWGVSPAARTTFHRRGEELFAELVDPAARVTLPMRASAGFVIADRTGVEARLSLRGAGDVPAKIADDAVVYRDALGRGRDVVHRVSTLGTEDFVTVDAPRSSLVYDIALGEHVAGLRLVERTIELVDRKGTPRLRMAPPYLIGKDRARVDASVRIEGCAFDSSPVAPWGRAPVDPGARKCAVRIGWGDVATPALLDPAWTTTGALKAARMNPASVTLGTGKVLIAGGYFTETLSSAELWDPVTGTTATTGAMLERRREMSAVLLSTGKVLVPGGAADGTIILSTAELYDPASGTFAATGSMSVQRSSYAIAPVGWTTPPGKPAIFGGSSGSTSVPPYQQYSSVETYDPGSGNWYGGQTMTASRRGATATQLVGGAVLIAGGGTTSAEIASATGTFAATSGSMSVSRTFHSAARLPDGKVLIVGTNLSSRSTAEIFDPATRTFAPTGALSVGRTHATTVLLPSGRVLVAGGDSDLGAFAEIFDSAAGRFFPTSATTARAAQAGALLSDGRVLIAGGQDYLGNKLSTAEVFAQLANGSACGQHGDCTSNNCIDGVCCDKPCAGSCEACTAAKKGSGSDGTCGVIANGTDPDKECAQQVCASGTQTNAFVCNGAGACRSNGTVTCSPYTCNGAGTACLTACTGDTTCVSTHWCNGSTCTPKGTNGAVCTANRECTSGQCWDSVCCDKLCDGACVACSKAKKGSGVDGVCEPVAAGTDPKNRCTQDSAYPTSCKADGFCDGAGACRVYAVAGTACGATTCADGKVSGLTCDTGGNCLSGTSVTCAPYVCGAAACKTTCAGDADCTSTAYCTSVSTCAPKKNNGQKCDANKECTSGNCVDGVCCNGTCLQQCEACNEPGSEGSCVPIKGAPRGTRTVCKGDPAICGGQCDGIKPNECAYAPTTKECGSKCAMGTEVKSLCDGAGSCAVGPLRACGAYTCDGETACKTSCTTTADCSEKYGCVGGKCVPAQSKCSDDGSKSVGFDGSETVCGSYLCDPALGACRKECTTSSECSSGSLCNLGNKQCEPPAAAPSEESGGCSYGAHGSPSNIALALLAIAFTLRARRAAE